MDNPTEDVIEEPGAALDAGGVGNPAEAKVILETALLASQQPLSLVDLRRMFDDDLGADTIRKLLDMGDDIAKQYTIRDLRWVLAHVEFLTPELL
mgnify:CR=1 FL=1